MTLCRFTCLLLAVCFLYIPSLFAHEAWLEPFEYHLAKSPLVRGHIRAGQLFRGNSQLYNPDKFIRFESIHAEKNRKVRGRLGDLPAIRHKLKQPGLHTLVYQSTGNVIRYPDWQKFEKFSDKEGVAWVQQAHINRGLPKQDFSEVFIRYAKALVTWKNSEGDDRPSGMPFELVALDNPYTANATEIRIQVLWQGAPYAGGQLTLFRKTGGSDTIRSIAILDDRGIAKVALQPATSYLLNSVSMEPVEGKKNTPVWRSHWASMTFQTR